METQKLNEICTNNYKENKTHIGSEKYDKMLLIVQVLNHQAESIMLQPQ